MKLQIVPPRTGVTWVREGLKAFGRRPLALVSLFFMFMALVSIASQIPVLGLLVAPMLIPSMSLALMAGAEQTAGPDKPPPATVFLAAMHALKKNGRALVVLGAIYAVGFLLIIGLSALIDGGGFAQARLMGEPVEREVAETGAFQLALWSTMLLNLPLSLAFWHAPALVHWHGVPPVKSLFFSMVACVRNMGALLVFALTWVGVCLGVGLLLSLTAGLIAMLGGGEGSSALAFGGAVMMGGAMVVAAMFLTSTYFSFRDSFQPGD